MQFTGPQKKSRILDFIFVNSKPLPIFTSAKAMKPERKTKAMSTIINNTEKTFSPSEQQVINKAMADYGVDKVFAAKNATDGGNCTLFDFYDENDTYLFSIDTDADGDCIVWER